MTMQSDTISRVRQLYFELNDQLTDNELSAIKCLLQGKQIPQHFATSSDFMAICLELERKGHISENNVQFLIDIFNKIGSKELQDKTQRLQDSLPQTDKHQLGESPQKSINPNGAMQFQKENVGHEKHIENIEAKEKPARQVEYCKSVLMYLKCFRGFQVLLCLKLAYDYKVMKELKEDRRRTENKYEAKKKHYQEILQKVINRRKDQKIKHTEQLTNDVTAKTDDLYVGQCEGCSDVKDLNSCIVCGEKFCSLCITPHEEMETSTGDDDVILDIYLKALSRKQSDVYCKYHEQHKMHRFCDSCQESVCPECIATHPSPDHIHRDIQDAAATYRGQLKQMMDKLKTQEKTIKSPASHEDTLITLKVYQEEEKKKIDEKAKKMISKIRNEQLRLEKSIKLEYEMMKEYLCTEFDEWEEKHGNISKACSTLETLLLSGDDAMLLSFKKETMRNIVNFVYKLNKRIKSNKMKFKPSDDIPDHGMLGTLEMDISTSMCKVENMPKRLVRGTPVNVKVICSDGRGNRVTPHKPIIANMIRGDKSSKNISVECRQIGEYHLGIEADVGGLCVLTLKLGDQPIPGSPFKISIKGLVRSIGEGQLKCPTGIASNSRGEFITTDVGKKNIYITDSEGENKFSFTFTQFKEPFEPQGVAISADDKYFMTDAGNNQVVVSDENGQMISSFGQNEIRHACGIGISPLDGSVYVTDWDGMSDETKTEQRGSHCVRKFKQCGQYIKSFGKFGMKDGEFWGPTYVALNDKGNSFVSDSNNYRIQVFSADCTLLYLFSTEHSILNPRGIVIGKDGFVYICDKQSKGVLQLDSRGNFISRVDSDIDNLEWPHGITLTNDNPYRVAVVEHKQGCIKVFAQ